MLDNKARSWFIALLSNNVVHRVGRVMSLNFIRQLGMIARESTKYSCARILTPVRRNDTLKRRHCDRPFHEIIHLMP